MSLAFKEIFKEDISITPYIAHKTWNVTDETTGSYGIKEYTAISSSYTRKYQILLPPGAPGKFDTFNAPVSTGSSGIGSSNYGYELDGLSHGVHNAMIWRSLDVLYYRPNRYNYINMGQPVGNYIPNTVTKLDATASVLSIPEQICGDGINPKSISITSTGIAGTITDNGSGYLISGSKNIGDVFYADGLMVVTDTGSAFKTIFNNFQLTFQGTHKIIENEYRCIITERDFMVPTNPTAMSGSGLDINSLNFPTGSGILAGFVSSSDFAPYITTIGLYNDQGELLVVGKPGQPIQNSQYYDLEFVLRFDT